MTVKEYAERIDELHQINKAALTSRKRRNGNTRSRPRIFRKNLF